MPIQLIGGGDLMARGVTNLAMLRPVLADNADVEQMLVGNATLRKYEWEQIDTRVNDVLRERLTVADDLRAAGLVTNVSLGTILRTTERLSDMEGAELSFDGDTTPQSDRATFAYESIPVPVLAKDFNINWRQLDASRRRGEPLDTTAGAVAARKVRDLLQDLITNGYAKGGPDGSKILGLTTATSRITGSLAAHWDASGADIIGDVEAMLAKAYAKNLFGPFVLYVPKNYWATIQGDYLIQGTSYRTYMERILSFVDIKAVRPNDALADDNVVMVQMTSDVWDMSEAQAVTTVQWEKNPFVTLFRVLTVAGPHIKSIQTDAGDTVHGIVHYS